MSKYMIIMANEDGNPNRFIDESELEDINELMGCYGIEKWVEKYDDPNYWEENEAMLLKVEISNPKPIKVVDKWEIER